MAKVNIAVRQTILFWIKPTREKKVWINYVVDNEELLDNSDADDIMSKLMEDELFDIYPYNDNFQVYSVTATPDKKLGWSYAKAPRTTLVKKKKTVAEVKKVSISSEPLKIHRNFSDSGLIDRDGNVYYCSFARHHELVQELSEKGIINTNWPKSEEEQELWREKYRYNCPAEHTSWVEDNGWVKFSMGGFHFGNSHMKGINDYHSYDFSLTQSQIDRILNFLKIAGDTHISINSGDWMTVEEFMKKIDPKMYSIINRPGNMDKNRVGNKAYNLGRLLDYHVNVPGFIVIPSETCQRILKEKSVSPLLISKIDFPEGKKFSVRSSAPISMPGMLDTFLNVSKSEVAEKIWKVVHSWNNPRAVEYRRLMNISNDCKISVIIQSMVNGSKDANSGSGIFVINGDQIDGEYVQKMAGEALVSGSVTPKKLSNIQPKIMSAIKEAASEIKRMTVIPQEVEFTYESGELYILQTRDFKVNEKSEDQPVGAQIGLGRRGNEGVAVGKIVFDEQDINEIEGNKIYVAFHTYADEVPMMAKCKGVLTAVGGALSHAAIVAKELNLPCVTGAGFKIENKTIIFGEIILQRGETVCVDGNTGKIYKV